MNCRAAHSACPYCRNRPLAIRCQRSSSVVSGNPGFSLTELLVAIAIIVVLMSLSAVAVNAARNSQKVNQSRLTIAKLDRILSEQLRRYESRYVPADVIAEAVSSAAHTFPPNATASQKRAWYIRRNLINGDMPDRWADVAYIATEASSFTTPSQNTYRAIWNSLSDAQKSVVPLQNESAECLFMIIMHGGFADCLDCGPMRQSEIGDTDDPDGDGVANPDGMPEFLDAWGNPIRFLLWAPGLKLPPDVSFFDASRQQPHIPLLGLRPLIYSAGPDGEGGYIVGGPTFNPTPPGTYDPLAESRGAPDPAAAGKSRDNITNFDGEVK